MIWLAILFLCGVAFCQEIDPSMMPSDAQVIPKHVSHCEILFFCTDPDPTTAYCTVLWGSLSGTYSSSLVISNAGGYSFQGWTPRTLTVGTTNYATCYATGYNGLDSTNEAEIVFIPSLPPKTNYITFYAGSAFSLTRTNPVGSMRGVVRRNGDVQFASNGGVWTTVTNIGRWVPMQYRRVVQ